MTDTQLGLAETLSDAWARISAGVSDPGSPTRFATLATVGTGGGAEARMLVLRGTDPAAGRLTFFTDGASSKAREVQESPQVTALFWVPDEQLQIRVRGGIETAQGARQIWDALPDGPKNGYGGSIPGQSLDTPNSRNLSPDYERFLNLTLIVDEIETLRLARPFHARARFRRADGFEGHWIAP